MVFVSSFQTYQIMNLFWVTSVFSLAGIISKKWIYSLSLVSLAQCRVTSLPSLYPFLYMSQNLFRWSIDWLINITYFCYASNGWARFLDFSAIKPSLLSTFCKVYKKSCIFLAFYLCHSYFKTICIHSWTQRGKRSYIKTFKFYICNL